MHCYGRSLAVVSPLASDFLCLPKESHQRKGTRMHRTLSRGDQVFPALLAQAQWFAHSLHSAAPRCASLRSDMQAKLEGVAFAEVNAVRLDCAARRRKTGLLRLRVNVGGSSRDGSLSNAAQAVARFVKTALRDLARSTCLNAARRSRAQ